MPNLRAAAHARLATVCLATLGEECTYLSKDGGSHTVTAVIEQLGEFQVDASGRDTEEVVRAFVMRDASHATYGGIANPQVGEALKLNRDPDGVAFTWAGEKRDVTEYSWVLMFRRRLPYSRGGGR